MPQVLPQSRARPINLDAIIFHLQEVGGVSVYWNELIRWLSASGNGPSIFASVAEPKGRIWAQLSVDFTANITHEVGLTPRLLRYVPFTRKLQPGTIFHSSYYRPARQRDVASVVTVYDFTHELFRKGAARILHSAQKRAALRRADGIICISENTRRDLLRFHPDLDPDRIAVIHLAAGDKFSPLPSGTSPPAHLQDVLRNKFVLYVSNRAAYKNFDLVVEAVADSKDLDLVMVGGGELTSDERALLQLRLPGRHHAFRFLDDESLNVLYNAAHCLLYLSSYEGFGVPLVEAMRAGCPIVISNRSCLPEVAGGAGLVVDRLDRGVVLDRLRALEDPGLRADFVGRGFQRACDFSWAKCGRETLDFYEKVSLRKFGKSGTQSVRG